MASSRKPAITSENFSLNWRRTPVAKTLVTSASSILRAPVLMLAIGKRLLPRAIDRNRVKRVARESWRLRVMAQPALARELSVFIRLHKRPSAFGRLTDRQVKAALRAEIDSLLDRLPVPSAPLATSAHS